MVTSGTVTLQVDDDSRVRVNGTMVPGLVDQDMGTSAAQTANITSYLQSGDNVIAFKAHHSAGGGYGVFDHPCAVQAQGRARTQNG